MTREQNQHSGLPNKLDQYLNLNQVKRTTIPAGLWQFLTRPSGIDSDFPQGTAEAYLDAQLRLLQAWHQGNINPDFISAVYSRPEIQTDPWTALCLESWTLAPDQRLLARPLTAVEINQEFPPDPDHPDLAFGVTQSYPLEPLTLPLSQGQMKLSVIGENPTLDRFMMALIASASFTHKFPQQIEIIQDLNPQEMLIRQLSGLEQWVDTQLKYGPLTYPNPKLVFFPQLDRIFTHDSNTTNYLSQQISRLLSKPINYLHFIFSFQAENSQKVRDRFNGRLETSGQFILPFSGTQWEQAVCGGLTPMHRQLLPGQFLFHHPEQTEAGWSLTN